MKKIILTGIFPFGRNDITAVLKLRGIEVITPLTNTSTIDYINQKEGIDYLVYGKDYGSIFDIAKQLKIKTISYEDFILLIDKPIEEKGRCGEVCINTHKLIETITYNKLIEKTTLLADAYEKQKKFIQEQFNVQLNADERVELNDLRTFKKLIDSNDNAIKDALNRVEKILK